MNDIAELELWRQLVILIPLAAALLAAAVLDATSYVGSLDQDEPDDAGEGGQDASDDVEPEVEA